MKRSDPVQRGFLAPDVDADSEEWWAAVAAKRLLLPQCGQCGLVWFPPTPGCPRCSAPEKVLVTASGRGRVYSWVVANRALHPAFHDDAPYVILAVDLEEGARIFGRLVGDVEDNRIAGGAPVHAVFYEVQGQVLVGFELDSTDR